jgi:hypothetical protein
VKVIFVWNRLDQETQMLTDFLFRDIVEKQPVGSSEKYWG